MKSLLEFKNAIKKGDIVRADVTNGNDAVVTMVDKVSPNLTMVHIEWDENNKKKQWSGKPESFQLQENMRTLNEHEKLVTESKDEVVEIFIGEYPYYLKKQGDSTHFSLANARDGVDVVIPSHIGQHRGEPYHDDVKAWLKGGKSPEGKKY